MHRNQLKRLNYNREIPEYEEDISKRIKRIKLEDDKEFVAEVRSDINMVSSDLTTCQKMSEFSGDSFSSKVEIEEQISVGETSKNVFSKSYINCLRESKLRNQLLPQTFVVNQVAMNLHEKMHNKTEFSLSQSAFLDNNVYISGELNVAFSMKTEKEYLSHVHSPMDYSREYKFTNASNFDHDFEDSKAIPSLATEKTVVSKNRKPEFLHINKTFTLLDPNLRFTSWNLQHFFVNPQSSHTFADSGSIFSAVTNQIDTDYPNHENYFQQYFNSENEIKAIEHTDSTTNNKSISSESSDPESQMKNTIVSLFMLEIKIKQCKEVLKKFGITSDSYGGFKKLKLKSAKLIKTCKILMNKRKRENMRIEKSRKRACSKKHNVLLESNLILNSPTLSIKEEEQGNSTEKERENISPSKTQHQSKKKTKTNDEMQKPGRSKILDECIMRLNSSKIYSRKNIKDSECLKEENSSQIWNSKGSPETKERGESELYLTAENMPENKQALEDPFDQEIDKILSRLPSLGSISNAAELSDQENMNIGLKELLDYGSENSKSFVLYPYVTA